MEIYKRISEANIKKYGTEFEKVLRIIINQYSDRTHFIYEIIQNAEDANASEISFHLKKDSFEIYHDGRPFDENDIEGVCGIANGTKEDGTRIGHFGIGFKSVYCYTEMPRIYSGQYHFQIKNQLFPEEIQAIANLPEEETCLVLPFNRSDVLPIIAYREIQEALTKKISAESILMLDNIKKVNIRIDDYDETISFTKMKNRIAEIDGGTVYALGISTESNSSKGTRKTTDKDFLFFSDHEAESAAVVYQVGGKDGKQLQPINNAKVYAYFPTAKEAHLNFYIHAPFDTTPARDNFKEGEEYGKHNLKLINGICDLITESLLWMRDNRYLSLASFNNVFPIYKYETNDILYGIYENSIAIISSGLELLPTNISGVYKAIENIFVPQVSTIVDTFTDDDLHRLISPSMFWLAKEISGETYSELRRFLHRNFELKTIDWSVLVRKLTASFLESKSIDWMEILFLRIESLCNKRTTLDNRYIDVSDIPLVRTATGKHVCARDNNGQLQVYLNNHNIARYRIAESCLRNSIIFEFYKNVLRIPEYDVVQEVLEKILPCYTSNRVKKTIEENINDLKTIKDAVYVNPSIKDKLSDKYLVTDGKQWYKPFEIYIPSADVRTGFALMKGIRELHFLSEAYFDDTVLSITLSPEFFKQIGCNPCLRVVEVNKEDYLKAVAKYCGRTESNELDRKIFSKTYISPKLNWSFTYEGFSTLFLQMSVEKSLKIAKFLNPNTMSFDIKGEIAGADDQHFTGKNVDTAVAYTMIGLILSFEKWIYVRDSEVPQRPIDTDRDDLRMEYRQVKRIMDVLPFKDAKNALSSYFKEIYDKDDYERVSRLVNQPKLLAKLADEYYKSEAREEAKKGQSKTIHDLLLSKDKSQIEGGKHSDGLAVSPISETGKRKREENLSRIFAESMNEKVSVARGLRFDYHESNIQERQFLLAEYSGVCQICEKQIVKHNGDAYFEAINIIKFSELDPQLKRTGRTGWNSLCLCPNCAAEFNYCSKEISTIYDQIMHLNVLPGSDDPIGIQIEMPRGTKRVIHYSPRHFMALKEAFKTLK